LKTLEEPPAHAVFILATTELEKVPETIISRCQSFVFKKPDQNTLGEVVINIFKKEGYSIDQSSSELIALLGDGSFRDTIGVVEKVIRSLPEASKKSKKISREDVETITGAPKATYIQDFITAVASKNTESGLSVLSATNKENINADLFAKLVLRLFRGAMLLKYAPAMKSDLEKEFGTDDFAFIESIVTKHGDGISSKVLVHLLDAYKQISFSPMPFIPLEISMIDIAEEK
jgi:DNA polymerase-3 subunit gamma/tau